MTELSKLIDDFEFMDDLTVEESQIVQSLKFIN